MSRLLYHTEEGYNRGESPFDRAIRETADSEEAKIVCPYISPTYVKSILRDVDNWRIITDVVAWVGAFHGESREEICKFIEEHQDRVHHFRHIHAKVVLSDDSAVLGSANLTEKGVVGRTEMGVEFNEEAKIKELREWFTRLWSESSPVDLEELDELIHTSPSGSSTHSRPTSLTSDAPRVNASFVQDTEPPIAGSIEVDDDGHRALVNRVQLAPSREWADSFFDLLSDLIAATGLTEDDSELVTAIPQKKRISISINRRMVLGAFFTGKAKTGFIIGEETENLDELIEKADGYLDFSANTGEDEEKTPHWVEYEGTPERMLTPTFRREWMKAAICEAQRASGSIHQSSHQPLVYQAAVNQNYRNQVLNEVFPNDV
ncbi:phospholipase D-like domain-containing protein [Haloferax sulfurifontis]|uniref:PLD phosphodiesterase domain-containing protein n=1 Tax=Haloferax sulfurifontis ATCC BAA-897 TaxID=662480 RepID=M0IFG9_9EURY|nr:phospholipase D-like domain-containing protein [Haloferax sulfurifontis]ELZ94588.1 hypothetical protein C441_07545 [Haloferax sulfurifontis ATCC BAA-897]